MKTSRKSTFVNTDFSYIPDNVLLCRAIQVRYDLVTFLMLCELCQ